MEIQAHVPDSVFRLMRLRRLLGRLGVGLGFQRGILAQVSGIGPNFSMKSRIPSESRGAGVRRAGIRRPCLRRGHGAMVSPASARASRGDTGARKMHERCTDRSSDARMRITRPVLLRPQSICEPGPPLALNQARRRWMRRKISGQIGTKYHGRPCMGRKRLNSGIGVIIRGGGLGLDKWRSTA